MVRLFKHTQNKHIDLLVHNDVIWMSSAGDNSPIMLFMYGKKKIPFSYNFPGNNWEITLLPHQRPANDSNVEPSESP